MFLLCRFCLKSCYCTGPRGRVNSQLPSSQLFNFNREKRIMKGQQKQRKDSLLAEAPHWSRELGGLFGQFLALTLTSFMSQASQSVSPQLWWTCPALEECRLSHWFPSPEPESSLSPIKKKKRSALSAEVSQLSLGELICLFEMNCSCDYSPHVPMRLYRAPAASVAQPWVIWHPLHTLIQQLDIFPVFMLQTLLW